MSAELRVGEARLRLIIGDITKIRADAVVNAGDSRLAGGGGVDGAIHGAGGPAIMAELDRIRPAGGCPTGSAVADFLAAGESPIEEAVFVLFDSRTHAAYAAALRGLAATLKGGTP